jgi:hypothetical protein
MPVLAFVTTSSPATRRPRPSTYAGRGGREELMATRGRKPDDARRHAVATLRAQGLSFTEIGARLGITRQCAQQLLKASGHSTTLPAICCTS